MRRPLPRGISVSDLAARFGGDVAGDGALVVDRLATLESAGPRSLSLLTGPSHRDAASRTRAGAVIAPPALAAVLPPSTTRLLTAAPYALYARIAQWFAAETAVPAATGIDASASVAGDAAIDAGASIGARCVVDAGAVIGEGASIGAGCYVGRNAVIGAFSRLYANVTVGDDCTIGARVIVHSGTVIGSDGFGFASSDDGWLKIPQFGAVVIGDDVEIGSNCSIDRGALDDTVIESGCKLDNLIQVAHNVRIGAGTAIAGCVGIAGSAVIGRNCMIGGAAAILGHLRICDGVTISAMSLVSRSISTPGFYTGVFPLMTNADWERAAATLRQLPQLRQRLRALEQFHKPVQGS